MVKRTYCGFPLLSASGLRSMYVPSSFLQEQELILAQLTASTEFHIETHRTMIGRQSSTNLGDIVIEFAKDEQFCSNCWFYFHMKILSWPVDHLNSYKDKIKFQNTCNTIVCNVHHFIFKSICGYLSHFKNHILNPNLLFAFIDKKKIVFTLCQLVWSADNL